MTFRAKKISKKSLFKILLIGLGIGSFFFFLLIALLSLSGREGVELNGEPVSGFVGFMTVMAMWPFLTLIQTFIVWLFSILGLWVYSFIRPISIDFIEEQKINDENV